MAWKVELLMVPATTASAADPNQPAEQSGD